MLPLTFAKPEDYEKVQPTDFVDLSGIETLTPGSKVTLTLKHKDGSKDDIELAHSFNEGQFEWFKAGSALNKFVILSSARPAELTYVCSQDGRGEEVRV